MKIVLPGGSGHLGTFLARRLHAAGHDVLVLTRRPRPAPWRVAAWDGATPGPWMSEIDGADVVLNLAGRSVNCRYSPANRREILDSRVLSTRVVGEAIARAARPPRVWLQMSTATIYAHRFDAPNDEATGRISDDGAAVPWGFSVGIARAWEAELAAADVPRTRRVALRSAIVMSPARGGIFDTLLGLVRQGLGGTVGDGRQMVSWIHDADFLRAVHWLIAHEEVDGAVNLVSPGALPNAEFMKSFRRAAGAWFGLPASGLVLEFGTWLKRTEPELVLKSRWAYPGRLLAGGFAFEHPEWDEAVVDLCRRWRAKLD